MQKLRLVVSFAGASLAFLALPIQADTFGSGANQFNIPFVNVGNAGNPDDFDNSQYGGVGGVNYDYRIAVYEISQDMFDKAAALGMAENVTAGAWAGSQPAADVNWYEAAAFVNWLNNSQGHHAAYDLTYIGGDKRTAWSMSLWEAANQANTGVDGGANPFRHKDAVYFLPSEDEWYKAANHRNDGATWNYWDYPTQNYQSNPPDGIDFAGDPNYDAVFSDGYYEFFPNSITDVGSSASAYGTYGQAGNVAEHIESAADGVNDSPSEPHVARGGIWQNSAVQLLPHSSRYEPQPYGATAAVGFRVASIVPEPTTLTLLGLGSLALVMVRRRR